MSKRSSSQISQTVGYNDLPDDCKNKIAQQMYEYLCRGIPGHYLDMPISEEMQLAGYGNGWAESGDSDMVRDSIDEVFRN